MPRWATEIEIAGVVFTGCRATLIDGNQFASSYQGSVDWANDGSVDAQTVRVGQKGRQFGVSMLSNEVTKIKAVLAAIETANDGHVPFIVALTDELYTINVYAITDFTQEWFAHGNPAENWVESVVFRFISKGAV